MPNDQHIDALTAGLQAALQPLNQIVGVGSDDAEWNKCRDDPLYFISNYCHIFNKATGKWELFHLWGCQIIVVQTLHGTKWIIILKARQLGGTWVVLCFLLWLCIFHPVQQALLFSIGDREAKDLTNFRLNGMCQRLPQWIHERVKLEPGVHDLKCSNGSRVLSMPSTAGHSYSGTFCLIDEADRVPDLNTLLSATEPVVESGGWMILLSTSDKSKPMSRFKNLFRLALKGESNYKPLFFPWNAHPGRTQEWYNIQRREVMAGTGALDNLWEMYPASPQEALAPRSLDKRIAATWLQQCMAERQPIPVEVAMRMY